MQALQAELARAKSKGYRVPELDYSKAIITSEQARSALTQLEIQDSLFNEVMATYRCFPKGFGAELNTLDQIVECAHNRYWEDDYQNFYTRFLELSSIEGEGSYFLGKNTGAVFDVGWSDMDQLFQGELKPKWSHYEKFLGWYYRINA